MLLIVRASQEQVLDRLGTVASGLLVGPTSTTGWTSIWSDEGPLPLNEFSEAVMIAEQDAGLVVEVAGPEGRRWCRLASELTPSNEMRVVAPTLARLFDAPQAEQDVLRVLVRAEGWEEELAEDLATVIDLPALAEPPPIRALVAHQGDPKSALLAGRLGGPANLTPLENSWSALSDVDEPGGYLKLSVAVAAATAGSRRRSTVIALWRGTSRGAGCALFTGDEITASKAWDTGWYEVCDNSDGSSPLVELSLRLSGGTADVVALRSLLRAMSWPSDPLEDLVALVGLPAGVIDLLDSPTQTQPTTQRLAPSSAARAWWEVVRSGGDQASAPRWLRWLFALGTVVAAVACLGMTVLTVAVVLTNGATVDQNSVSSRDWILIAVFLALTLILTPAAVWRLGRARR